MNKRQLEQAQTRRLGPSAEKSRKFGDPAFIGPRGKNRSERRSRNDPGWTPSEQRMRAKLMKQFARLEGPSGNSEAYRNSGIWCHCGRLNGSHVHLEMPELNKQLDEMGRASFDAAVRGSNRR